MLTALSVIAAQQANPTEATLKKAKCFLDYCTSQDEAVLTYNMGDMVLGVHSNVGYLNETNKCSQARGHFFLPQTMELFSL